MRDPVGPVKRTGHLRRVPAVAAGLLLSAFGGFVMSMGQADDSPGLGALGLIAVVAGLVMGFRVLGTRRGVR